MQLVTSYERTVSAAWLQGLFFHLGLSGQVPASKWKSCDFSTALQPPQPRLFRTTWLFPSLGHSAPLCGYNGQNTGGSMEKVLHIKWRNYSSLSNLQWSCSTFRISLDRGDKCHLVKPPTHLSREDWGQLTGSISVLSYPKPKTEK